MMEDGNGLRPTDDVKTSEAVEQEVEKLLSQMTLDEKIVQMSGTASLLDLMIMTVRYNHMAYASGENKRLGIPPIRFSDGPRGVVLGRSTCFPVSMARGATWDPELEERIAGAMGIEARAQGANFMASACINLLRHPAWGRAQETYGEDPCLLGAMGSAHVRGLQRHVMACVKHFACNSIENSRFYVDVRIDERTLREVYLPHFKACVDAGAASVMSAYNRVNGAYCAHNAHLLRRILKEDWGFDGFVVSDFCLGLYDGRAAALGGLDIEMPNTRHYGRRLKRLVKKGTVPGEVIDDAVSRILRQKLRFQHIGDPGGYGTENIARPEHIALALEAARKSMVLLKNNSNALPMDRNRVKRIAVFGRLAAIANIGDRGSSRVRPPYTVAILDGIRKKAGNGIKVSYYAGRNPKQIARLASEADTSIIVAGLTTKEEGEYIPFINPAGDRKDLGLPPSQIKLIADVRSKANTCIVVLQGGSAIRVHPWVDEIDALLMAWYPGMEGGTAVADILFGDVNPSGKLPLTMTREDHHLVPFDCKSRRIEYGFNHGYRKTDREGIEPSFHFGFGMSYTTFEYSNLVSDVDTITGKDDICFRFDVTNTGNRSGEEVAQVYVGYDSSQVIRPVRELKRFVRVPLAPGETKTMEFRMNAEELAYYNEAGKCWNVEVGEYSLCVGASSDRKDLFLTRSFRIVYQNSLL